MRSALGSGLVTAGVIGVSLVVGALAGAYSWFATAQSISHRQDGDDINLVGNFLASDSLLAGLIAGVLATVLVAALLSLVAHLMTKKSSSS
ncbi:MAG: hypothetical protein IT547_18225 [Hyphomonadaceae bacterium]|nr:hypothetical protein [Hyphomonadaceae bacterium]